MSELSNNTLSLEVKFDRLSDLDLVMAVFKTFCDNHPSPRRKYGYFVTSDHSAIFFLNPRGNISEPDILSLKLSILDLNLTPHS